MKRVTLVVAALLCAAVLTAQSRTQTGNATQEMQTPGLSAAHNSLPLGSKAKIKNLSNGREVEVTITGQIPASTRRIIDLSPSTALALELGFGGLVVVTPLGLLQSQITPPEPEPYIPEPLPPIPEPAPQPEKSSEPYTIIINNYIVNPEELQLLQKSGILPFSSGDETPFPAGEQNNGAPTVSYSVYTAPPVSNVRITPALPDPHSGKIYRLLVGTYPGVEGAFPIFRQLKSAGFEVVLEQAGTICRVYVVGIPAPSVYHAAQRLGAIGIEQVSVHE